jgi:hypothetical protein
MTGGEIKPAAQNRFARKRRKLADQQKKHLLSRILGKRCIAKDPLAGRLDHWPMEADELSARRLAQGKRTIPGALWHAKLAFASAITGHTILLPQAGKLCEEFLLGRTGSEPNGDQQNRQSEIFRVRMDGQPFVPYGTKGCPGQRLSHRQPGVFSWDRFSEFQHRIAHLRFSVRDNPLAPR